MFLKKCKYKNGRTYLSIVNGYKVNGVVKHEVIKKLGYLDELEKEYDDPIAHFTKLAKEIENDFEENPCIENLKNQKLIKNSSNRKNIGYVFIKKIYNELNLKMFFKSKQSNLNIQYNLNDIFSLLVFPRILYPGSKKETFEGRKKFFESFEHFELSDVYKSLDYFKDYKEELETLIWNNTKNSYNRDTSNTYYDCTNYFLKLITMMMI